METSLPVTVPPPQDESVIYSSTSPNECVTCILVSNNPDGQVLHQLIQLPSESVLVVGSDPNHDNITYHPAHNAVPREHLRSPSPPVTEPLQTPPPAENTDHNSAYYSQTFCKDCNKIFPNPSKLRDHNLNKHKGLYTCGVCLRGFRSPGSLRLHTAIHNKKQYVCSYCDKTFSRGASLKIHIRKLHKKEEKCLNCGRIREPDHICYKCQQCLASFKTVSSFEQHNCGKTRIFVCPYCGESFTRHQGLLNHMLNQENKRKFQCVVCKDRFNTQAQLRRHERIHEPEQWFKCETCGKKYASASGFRSHNIDKHSGHKANALPPRNRINQKTLRKRTHRKYRDDGVQTNPCALSTRSCQTSQPVSPSSSSPPSSPVREQSFSETQESSETMSSLDETFHDDDRPSVYDVPALLKCSDDVIIVTDRSFE